MSEKETILNHKPPSQLEDEERTPIQVGEVTFYPEFRVAPGGAYTSGNGIVSGYILREDGEKIPSILKVYRPRDVAAFNASVQMHDDLREMGVRVPEIIARENGMIVSADLNHTGYVALSANNPSDIVLPKSVESIYGLEEVVMRMCMEVMHIADKEVMLHPDAFFVLLDRHIDPAEPHGAADFFVGDSDNIRRLNLKELSSSPRRDVPSSLSLLFEYNLEVLVTFWGLFLAKWSRKEIRDGMMATIVGKPDDGYGLLEYVAEFGRKQNLLDSESVPIFLSKMQKKALSALNLAIFSE